MRLLNRSAAAIVIAGVFVYALSFSCYAYGVIRVADTADVNESYYSVVVNRYAPNEKTAYAVWSDYHSGKIYFNKSVDLGKTWGSNPRVIATKGVKPRLCIDKAGNLIVAYSESTGYGVLRFLKSIDGGITFDKGGAISLNGLKWGSADWDIVAAENGATVYAVVSTDLVGNLYMNSYVKVYASTDGCKTFSELSSIQHVSIRVASGTEIQTSHDGKDVYLFLVINSRLHFAKSTDYGKTFSAPRLIGNGSQQGSFYDPGRHNRHLIDSAIDNGNAKIYFAWTAVPNSPYDPANPRVILTESGDKGDTFSHAQVSDTGMPATRPAIAVDGNGAVYCSFLRNIYNGAGLVSHDVYLDKKGVNGNFGKDEYIARTYNVGEPPGTTAPIPTPLVAVTAKGAKFILWADKPNTLNTNKDLYGVSIPSVNLEEIGDKVVSAGSLLTFTVSATGGGRYTINDPLTYNVYPLGDLDRSGMLVPKDVLAFYSLMGSKVDDANWNPMADFDNNGVITPLEQLMILNQINAGKTRLPVEIELNSSTGAFKWAPTASNIGVNYVTFVVSDGAFIDVETVAITVVGAPVIDAINHQQRSRGSQVTVTGRNFGSNYNALTDKKVCIYNRNGYSVSAQIIDWTNNSITFIVPNAPRYRYYDIAVQTSAGTSNVKKIYIW